MFLLLDFTRVLKRRKSIRMGTYLIYDASSNLVANTFAVAACTQSKFRAGCIQAASQTNFPVLRLGAIYIAGESVLFRGLLLSTISSWRKNIPKRGIHFWTLFAATRYFCFWWGIFIHPKWQGVPHLGDLLGGSGHAPPRRRARRVGNMAPHGPKRRG